MGRGQAERLVPMLEEVLADEGFVWDDLDAIAVGIGPGNFTGLRLAVATARGLAMAKDIAAIGVSGFDAIAAGAEVEGPVLVLLENRKGSDFAQAFFCADWDTGADGTGTDRARRAPGPAAGDTLSGPRGSGDCRDPRAAGGIQRRPYPMSR